MGGSRDRHHGRRRDRDRHALVPFFAFAVCAAFGASAAFASMPVAPASASGTSSGPSSELVDTGSLSAISQITGAQAMWNLGFTGAGVGVAVIDTGVARVPGLDRAGKVIDGPDLSFDSQVPGLVHTDAFGHGTHIAGIIAGSDVAPGGWPVGCATCTGLSPYTDTTKFVGIAPEARIVNVKVGAYDGSVDVTQIIAGINWVIQHRFDPGLNIRVLNLSFGTDSVQPAEIDPLAFAVEAAWRAGIVVVAAAGNDGPVVGPLGDPAISPSVIAVGATDPVGTLKTSDDVVASFAQHGTTQRGVDVSAPGVSVMSLRVPDGFVDQNVTTGKVGTRFQRASGTSQSTAVVSGLAALILSKLPFATPDQVKALLTLGAQPVKADTQNKREYVGTGVASLATFARLGITDLFRTVSAVLPTLPSSTGTGSLEESRGTYHVTAGDIPLGGERDIFGRPWNTAALAAATTAQSGWRGGTWSGSQWTADLWSNGTWPSVQWSGTDWIGAPWQPVNGDVTSTSEWSGARWSGARWSGARWSGARWSGARWSGARWSDASWS